MASEWTNWNERDEAFESHWQPQPQPQPQPILIYPQTYAETGSGIGTLPGFHAPAADEHKQMDQQPARQSWVHEQPEMLRLEEGCSISLFPQTGSHREPREDNRIRLKNASLRSAMPVSSAKDLGEYGPIMVPHSHVFHIDTVTMTSPAPLAGDTAHPFHFPSQKLCINPTGTASIPFSSVVGGFHSENTSTTEGSALLLPTSLSQKTLEDVEKEFENFPFTLNISFYIRARFMPQSTYRSNSRADHNRYIKDANLQPTIVFYSKDLENIGIALRDVLSSKARIEGLLANPNEFVLHHGPPSASIRLQVPGYTSKKKQKCQICIRTRGKHTSFLTTTRLLRLVTNAIDKILRNLALEQQDFQRIAHLPFQWTIGNKPGQISIENLYIVSLHNVSKGTWQPQVYLDPRYTLPHGNVLLENDVVL